MLKILSLISTVAVACIGLGSLYLSYRTYKLDQRNTYSKLSIKIVQDKQNAEDTFGEREYSFCHALNEAKEELGTKYGFPTISLSRKYNYKKVWIIELLNDGGWASTNIKLDYSVIVKRTELEFGRDESDVISDRLVDFYTYNHDIEIPYLGGNQVQKLPILMYDGEFPEADLIINSLTSDQTEFITKPVKVDTIKHPDFDWLEDSPHLRKMWGLLDDV